MASNQRTGSTGWQWLAAATWAVILLLLSTVSSSKLPEIESWSDLIGVDKWAHLLVYAVFAVLLYLPLRSERMNAFGLSILISAGFGAGMEFLQAALSTGRAYELADMLANTLGAFSGALLIRWRMTTTNK